MWRRGFYSLRTGDLYAETDLSIMSSLAITHLTTGDLQVDLNGCGGGKLNLVVVPGGVEAGVRFYPRSQSREVQSLSVSKNRLLVNNLELLVYNWW